jgi:hypothetical protein
MSFFLDIETLSTESTAVILSVGMCYARMDSTYSNLQKDSIFIKLNAKEQLEKYKRVTSKDTLDWWDKQPIEAKRISLFPSETDVSTIDGINSIKHWMKQYPNYKQEYVWTRGSLDQMAFDSLCKSAGQEVISPYWNYRDIRTLLDCIKTTTERGYCKIEYPHNDGLNYDELFKLKHDPVVDVRLDALQLIYGK